MVTKSSLSVILNEVKPQRATCRVAANLSRSGRAKTVTGVRWVAAPHSSLPGAPVVQGVMLAANENVQWSWTHTANGSYVSGYTIVRPLPKKRRRSCAALKVIDNGRSSKNV